MKANELRIGNLVLSNNPLYRKDWLGKVLSVLEIKDESVSVVAIDELPYAFTGGQFLKYIDPIPLTEEILLKCGFKKQDYNMSNCHVYQKGSYRVLKSFNDNNINQDYSLCINGISPPTWSIAHFKYVHQFQNLYFALTNTELEINL